MTKEEFISMIKIEYKCEPIEEEEWNGEPLANRDAKAMIIDVYGKVRLAVYNT